MRNPVVAGQFYSGDAPALEEEIKACFSHSKGPGDLPVSKRSGKILGAIVPHAGYMYSGPCAAWVYKEIAEAEMPDVFIILGVNHTGRGRSSTMTRIITNSTGPIFGTASPPMENAIHGVTA